MTGTRVHAFTDDALAEHDAVAVAELVRRGEISPAEAADAAVARAEKVASLHAVAFAGHDRPRTGTDPGATLYGVPSYLKDNTDLAGMPTNHGTDAYTARPAAVDGRYARQYLATGMTVLGKSALPEYGFNASSEFRVREPVRNPWHTDYSVGASSGGAAALVASGVVPIAHANDGGGSIRIPAACAGLVGLKPSRGRHVNGEQARALPVNLISEGVLTRTVRDTAAFLDAAERHWRNPALPPIGLVHGPARRRLRIGLLAEGVAGVHRTCAETRATLDATASLLERHGHLIEPIDIPVDRTFVDDFVLYWGLLAFLAASTGKLVDRGYDRTALDGLTMGLRRHYLRHAHRTPTALRRLAGSARAYAGMFARHELILSPVLAHVTPPLGYLSPTVPFDELLTRLTGYVAFTPFNNTAGGPAISLPMGVSSAGLPIGVQLSAARGDERTLLETAFALEADHPWPRIQAG
jgi:amidase